jgi:ribonuclease HI
LGFLLRAHRELYDGITLPSVVGKTGIRKNNDGYVDDVDTWAGSLEVDPEVAKWVIQHLEQGAQKWADLQDVVGQSTAFHKCFVQILAHNLVRDSYEIDYETVHSMVLHDSKGAGTKIKFIPANEPNPGLGFHICPDGNQDHEFSARKEKTSHICKAAQSIFLDQLTTKTLLYSRLVPQAAYVMRLSQFTEKQCHQLDVMVNRTFLPLMKVNRNTPRAVVHGPIQYGGMNLLKHSALQDQWNLHYFVQSLRWDDIVANDIITVLDLYQLRTGFVTNVLTTPDIKIDYMPQGLIHHIRSRLRALSGELHVEKAWSPQLQRKEDDSIMERVAACTTLTRKERRLTNELRIYKRIICISDIATPDGTSIPWERMQKFQDWRALPPSDTRMRWPNVPPPSTAHYSAFRKAIRHTFCTRMSPHQRSRYILDTPLGPWKLCTKHSLHSSYIDVDHSIYVCDEEGTFKCTITSTAKTYEINYGTKVTLPPTAIPTQVTMLQGTRIRVDTRQYLLYTSPQAPSQNAIFDDTFVERKDENITIVSDCAVEVANGRAAGAWHIYHDKDARRRVARTIEHLKHAHSYRDEMTIMYHALADAETALRHPHKIIQMMDNEAGLNTLDTPITYPSQTMGTDMDVTLAYQKLRSESKHTVDVKWVMGHADRKKKNNPQDITPSEYTNIDCDEEASLRLSDEATPAAFHPFPGYKAMLRLGQDWVTTQLRDCVQFANTAPAMAEYIRHRLEITEETFQTIDWAIIGHVRASHRFSRQIRTSKMMFGWMPVGHNWIKCNLQSDRCPCCGAPDETFDHVLSCEGEQMAKARNICYTSFLAGCKENKIPTILARTILESLKMVTENKPRPSPHHIPSVEKALIAQDKIGYSNMSVGFYATEWRHVAEDMGVEQPQTAMERILSLMWDTINEQMWAERNSIKHSKESHTLEHEKIQQIDQLLWYVRHQNEVLDYRHRYLVDFTIEDARRWSRHTRSTKLQHLHNAREYYEIETRQKSINQSTIFDWLHSYTTLRSGTVIGPGIRRSSAQPHSVSSDDASASTEEAEFEW